MVENIVSFDSNLTPKVSYTSNDIDFVEFDVNPLAMSGIVQCYSMCGVL